MQNMQKYKCTAVGSNFMKHTKAYKSKQCSVFDAHLSKAAIVSHCYLVRAEGLTSGIKRLVKSRHTLFVIKISL